MSHPFDSLDAAINLAATYGSAPRAFIAYTPTTTSPATTAAGYAAWQQFAGLPPVPAYTSPVTGYVLTSFTCLGAQALYDSVFGLQYLLGQITLNGGAGTSANLAAMPTKTPYGGTSTQTSTPFLFAVVTTVLSATTPTITITYKNESGTGSRTITWVAPTNSAVNTCMLLAPFLQSGDKAVQEITAISSSGGASGVIKFYGVLPMSIEHGISTNTTMMPTFVRPLPVWTATSTDSFGYYRSAITITSQQALIDMELVPTTS